MEEQYLNELWNIPVYFFSVFSKGMKLIKKIQKKKFYLKNPLSEKFKENLNLKDLKKLIYNFDNFLIIRPFIK